MIGLNATPIFNIGAVLMTIDALSIFFWMTAMFTFWLALENVERIPGLVVLADYRSADRAGLYLSVHRMPSRLFLSVWSCWHLFRGYDADPNSTAFIC